MAGNDRGHFNCTNCILNKGIINNICVKHVGKYNHCVYINTR